MALKTTKREHSLRYRKKGGEENYELSNWFIRNYGKNL